MPNTDNTNLDNDVLNDLLNAEREQEITQITTLQGQIIALVMILRDIGILRKNDVDRWEKQAEESANLLVRIMRAGEVVASPCDDNPKEQLNSILDGVEATIELTSQMGGTGQVMQPLLQQKDALEEAIRNLPDDS